MNTPRTKTNGEKMRPSVHTRLGVAACRTSGFTRVELLVVAAVGLVIVALGVVIGEPLLNKSRMGGQLSQGRQIYLAMRSYASETGRFPAGRMIEGRAEWFGTSNDAFTALMERHIDDKRVFFNRQSAYCIKLPKSPMTRKQVLPGECDWVYVRGMTVNAHSQWPILANAFAPGTKTYVDDPKQKGGVYRGERAIVIWAGGSAEVVNTKKRGTTYFVKRWGKPEANAFEKDGDWLAGNDVEVLYPK